MTTDAHLDAEELAELEARARSGRRSFARSPLGAFARAMRQVMRDYEGARAAGVSREDAVKGIEEVLREVWPGKVTKFPACDGCDGTGWRLCYCTDALRCRRELCTRRHPAWEHTYVVPCECEKGDKFRPRLVQPDDLGDVAKTRKRRSGGWSRMGR
jgi:hypothetical protein